MFKKEFNYNFIEKFDVSFIKHEVLNFTNQWHKDTSRQNTYKAHKDTLTYMLQDVSLLWKMGEPLDPVKKYEADYEWDLLSDIMGTLLQKCPGSIGRVMYINLPSGKNVPYHRDGGYYLSNVRRFHIPIITNDDVLYIIGEEEKNMKQGECWEINNNNYHSVVNNGESDRVHLVMDIVPNEVM